MDKIRVIEVKRQLTDPATASQEELALILEAVRAVPELAHLDQPLKAFLTIGKIMQGRIAPLLVPSTAKPPQDALDSVLVRDLLANPAVRPVVAARGSAANVEQSDDASPKAHIRIRAATRTRAIDLRGIDIALAAEEPADVVAFAVDPLGAGSAVIDMFVGERFLGLDVYAASGAYPAPVLPACGPVRPPEYPELDFDPGDGSWAELGGPISPNLVADLRKRGFAVVPATTVAVRALLRQSRAAVGFYLSGAAVAISLAQVRAAALGEPGAMPELLAALGPPLPALPALLVGTDDAGPAMGPAEAAWRSKIAQDRLRWFVERLAATEPIAVQRPETWAFDTSILIDMFRVGAFGMYLVALTEGRDSSRIEQFLELLAIRRSKESHQMVLALQTAKAASRARLLVSIIGDKFGAARVNAVLDGLRVRSGVGGVRDAPGGSLALMSDTVQVNDPEIVLSLLSKREREVAETEYANRVRAWEAAVSNKCPHLRVARRLRAAPTADAAYAALQELEKYFDESEARPPGGRKQGGPEPEPAPGEMWIMCRLCSFRALCPHVRDRMKMEARHAPYEAVRSRLLRYSVRVQDPRTTDSLAYYCRICGEKLAEMVDDDRAAETLGRFGDLDAGLRTKVWTIALNAARHVRFPMPVDDRQFASAVTAVVYPLLLAAEETIVRKKGRRRRGPAGEPDPDAEELDPRTELYASIFVYAYILDQIRATKDVRGREIGFENVKLGSKEGAFAERMLNTVVVEQRAIISQIEDISPEFLKSRFAEAYRIVRGESLGPLQAANAEEELAVQITVSDPVYRYAASVARVAGAIPVGRPDGPEAARREFETIMGMALPEIVLAARENAKNPALAAFFTGRGGPALASGVTVEYVHKDPRLNLYSKLYEPKRRPSPAASAALRSAADSISGIPATGMNVWIGAAEAKTRKGATPARPHAQPARPHAPPARPHAPPARPHAPTGRPGRGKGEVAFELGGRPGPYPGQEDLAEAETAYFFESYRLFAKYTRGGVRDAESFKAYQTELAALRQAEDGIRYAQAINALKPYYDAPIARTQQYVPVAVSITMMHDESGQRHDWSRRVVYHYLDPSGGAGTVRIEGGAAGVKRAIEGGRLTKAMRLVDLECPDCGVLFSKAQTLNAGKAWSSLRAASEIDSFYVFYESRCPAGDLHHWADEACEKCGLTAEIIKEVVNGRSANHKGARAYYDAHLADFIRDRREMQTFAAPVADQEPGPGDANDPEAARLAREWRPDYSLIVRVAELAEATPHTIEAIGATERREYSDIAEGKGAPPPPTSVADPRILAADAEVRAFLSDYSTLRNFARIRQPPQAITDILAAANTPKHEYHELPSVLPDIGSGYRGGLAAMLRLRSPADALTFIIQSLCGFVLRLSNLDGPPGKAWVRQLGAEFGRREILYVIRSQRRFSKPGVFNWAIFETGEESIQEQVGDVGEDITEDILNEDQEEGPEDPFSGEGMDYDTSENNSNNEPA